MNLSIPSSIFQKTIVWNGNFGTGGSVIITPFTKNAANLFLFDNNTWRRPDFYVTPLITKAQIKYGGQHRSQDDRSSEKWYCLNNWPSLLFSALEQYVCDSCSSRKTEILQWWLIICVCFHSWNAYYGLWFHMESNIRQLLHKKSQMILLPWLPSQFTNESLCKAAKERGREKWLLVLLF